MARRLCAAGVFACAMAMACGGTVETRESSTTGGSAGVGGANAGSGGRGGSSSGSGGSSSGSGGATGGSGGSTSSPFDNCVSMCDRVATLQCPNGGFDPTECLRNNCATIGTRGEPCDAAFASAFACFAETIPPPITCDDGGRTTIRCGPCDNELAAVSAQCGESIKCTF